MNIILFYHSLLSDWNHGNAHFLRGVATELIARGNTVKIYEPLNGWSFQNLLKDAGEQAIEEFYNYYPNLDSEQFDPSNTPLDTILCDADLVIVHEWNDHTLVKSIGEKRKKIPFKLLFHDTHHRTITDKKTMSKYDLSNYDGVLAYGKVIENIYIKEQWAKKAWTWHEAADTRIFQPIVADKCDGDLIWIGNWGDDERTKELVSFLIEPVKTLGLKAKVYGVRYPEHAIKALADAGISYGGWLPNFKVPEVFSRYRFTAHIPRQPYVQSLPGIPTIRPFEAMACGIALLSSPWNDTEHLFTAGKDFLFAGNKEQMIRRMQQLMQDDQLVDDLTQHALTTIHERHTCAHRVDELYTICETLGVKNLNHQKAFL
ncbi:MAG: glycosyltransferase [Bacteroidota bacterium]